MDKNKFLYWFVKFSLSEAVKETILIENWEEGDFCARYIEYADMFTRYYKDYTDGKIHDKDAIDIFSKFRKDLVGKFNQTMSNKFLEQLTSQNLAQDAAQRILANKIPLGGDNVNQNILEVYRELEEEVYASSVRGVV